MKQQLERLQRRDSGVFDVFPNTKTIAAYYPGQQFIELSEVDSKKFKTAFTETGSRDALDVLPLVFHELRHWLDHISTCWGQKRLIRFFNALHTWESQNPADFWRIADYKRGITQDRFEKYYSTIGRTTPSRGGDPRWQWQLTAGRRFDSNGQLDETRPIAFTRFAWQDGEQACRVPFSVASLLECGAVYFEQFTYANALALLDKDIQAVEGALYQKRSVEELYSPNLAVYSVAAHMAANRLGFADISSAYKTASDLASVCLNLPSDWFARVAIPDDFETWANANGHFISNRDRGYVYMALVHHAKDRKDKDSTVWVDETLAAANLPGLTELSEVARQEMQEARQGVLPGAFRERLDWLLDKGSAVFDELGPLITAENVMHSFSQLPVPPILLSDFSVEGLNAPSKWSQEDVLERWIDQTLDIEINLGDFLTACGS